ncbi:preprotein translocase subunit YajC [Bombilactobacillus thymidiniphilus]|uniref:Preprotein translocase subunit YajC n=1 Tax=Bombilactobacillus thymidiniphilus TaxID=2923363 RepID=A0ABY4PE11_9LACO|nr:preprotein translocase subunit YajC [Bombilactobacillus thymidiniphilus]UQS83903.1 preprotein translocase subunit YajC [Bombilactobacillus thymidiniphilus]
MKLLAASSGVGGNSMIFIFFILMIVLMYFTMFRPQKKQEEQRKKMLNALKVGDAVTTIGGLHGTIDTIDDDNQTIVLDCDGIYLTFARSAIRGSKVGATAAKPTTNSKQAEAEKPESEQSVSDTEADANNENK